MGGRSLSASSPVHLRAWRCSSLNGFARESKLCRIQNGGDSFQVTVSIGVTLDPGESLEQMITRADQGLYQAKAAGRNRVELN